jgi:L-idonate 5-dehydrogenase
MKAAVVHGAGDLRISEGEPVPPGPDEVQVRMTHGGVCGSDLHYYAEGKVGVFSLREPLVLGHEVVGRIENDGRAQSDPDSALASGTPVAIHPATPCGRCPECVAGRPNICRDARYLGSAASWPHTQGAFSELFTARVDQVRVLPEGLPLERAVLAEPLGVALHALHRAGGVTGKKVLVSGAGPIGLLAVGAALAMGASEVWAVDLLEHPLVVARRLGATGTIRLGEAQVPAQEFDVVIEAAGVPAAVTQAIRAARRGGVVVQVGMLPADPRPVALSELVSREVELRGAFRFDNEIDAAIELLARDDSFAAVVTQVFDADDAVAAFECAADPSRSSKVVLKLWGKSGQDLS